MNNEPVAWIGKPELQFGFTDTRVTNEKESWDDILLYTHPVKELTDEEIEKVRVAIMNTAYWCADENMPEAYNAIKVCCSEVLAILERVSK